MANQREGNIIWYFAFLFVLKFDKCNMFDVCECLVYLLVKWEMFQVPPSTWQIGKENNKFKDKPTKSKPFENIVLNLH